MHIHQIGKTYQISNTIATWALPLHTERPHWTKFLELLNYFTDCLTLLKTDLLKECSCFFKTTNSMKNHAFSPDPPPLCWVPWNHPINAKWLHSIVEQHRHIHHIQLPNPWESASGLQWWRHDIIVVRILKGEGMCLPLKSLKTIKIIVPWNCWL